MTEPTKLVDALRTEAAFHGKMGIGSSIKQLLEEAADAIEAAEKDAARYRWLRSGHEDTIDIFRKQPEGDELDAAIDAALAAGGSRE